MSWTGPGEDRRDTVAVIQARMGSTRLPGKVLLPFGGESLLAYLVRRVARAETLDRVVVATSVNRRDDAIVRECNRIGVDTFRGSEFDVLRRYVEAAEACDAGIVVRVTADNPFTDPDSIDRVVGHIRKSGARYALEDRLPLGTTGEALTGDLLMHLDEVANLDRWREHVTLYAKEHLAETGGTLLDPRPGLGSPGLRLTIDTLVDYLWAQEVRRNLEARGGGPESDLQTLVQTAVHLSAAA